MTKWRRGRSRPAAGLEQPRLHEPGVVRAERSPKAAETMKRVRLVERRPARGGVGAAPMRGAGAAIRRPGRRASSASWAITARSELADADVSDRQRVTLPGAGDHFRRDGAESADPAEHHMVCPPPGPARRARRVSPCRTAWSSGTLRSARRRRRPGAPPARRRQRVRALVADQRERSRAGRPRGQRCCVSPRSPRGSRRAASRAQASRRLTGLIHRAASLASIVLEELVPGGDELLDTLLLEHARSRRRSRCRAPRGLHVAGPRRRSGGPGRRYIAVVGDGVQGRLGHRVHGVLGDEVVDVHGVAVGGVLDAGRGPQRPLRPRRRPRERLPALGGETSPRRPGRPAGRWRGRPCRAAPPAPGCRSRRAACRSRCRRGRRRRTPPRRAWSGRGRPSRACSSPAMKASMTWR